MVRTLYLNVFSSHMLTYLYPDEEVVGKLAELDIVMMDLERANGRIVELERKNVSDPLCR